MPVGETVGVRRWLGAVVMIAVPLFSQATLDEAFLKMLHDPHGWHYAGVGEEKNGKEVIYACFDYAGQPQMRVCHGNLNLTTDGHFVQKLTIEERHIERRGMYELVGGQLTLIDEEGNHDGAYTVDVRPKIYYMALRRWVRGVKVGAEFELQREFQRRMKERNKQNQ
jgi:hypothetical protein